MSIISSSFVWDSFLRLAIKKWISYLVFFVFSRSYDPSHHAAWCLFLPAWFADCYPVAYVLFRCSLRLPHGHSDGRNLLTIRSPGKEDLSVEDCSLKISESFVLGSPKNQFLRFPVKYDKFSLSYLRIFALIIVSATEEVIPFQRYGIRFWT